jgi:hypothetical protein
MRRTTLPLLLVPLLALGLAACAITPPVSTSTPVSTAEATPPTPTTSPATSTTASSTTTPAAGLELRGDGLGAFPFGTKQSDVTALLEQQLGEPEESTQGIRCELDESSPWSQTVSWGDFWVRYDAKDGKKASPRTLASWGIATSAELGEGMSVQDDVPLTLSFAQLKAAYPTGRTENLGLGDGSKRFILPNDLFFVGAGTRPDHLEAGSFGVCE